MKKLYIIFVLSILSLNSFSQNNGPGGVGDIRSSDVMLWLRADDLSSLNDGDNVTQWDDVTAYGNNAVSLSGNDPTYNSSGSYPVVDFTSLNGDFFKVADAVSMKPTTGLTMFVVGSYTTSTSTWSPFVIKTDTWSWTKGYGLCVDKDNNRTLSFINAWNGDSRLYGATNTSGTVNRIMEYDYDLSDVYSSVNEGDIQTKLFSEAIINVTNNLYIGASPNADGTGTRDYLDGEIAEIVLINRGVNEAERIIVANYLYGKYNIGISNNHWTYSLDYKDNIIGVGVASDGSTHSSSTGGILTLNHTNGDGSEGYAFCAENGLIITPRNCAGTPNQVTYLSDKIWKFDFTTFTGDLEFVYDLSQTQLDALIGAELDNALDIKLLYSLDPNDFSNAGVVSGTLDLATKKATFSISGFLNSSYTYYAALGIGRGTVWDGTTWNYINDDGTPGIGVTQVCEDGFDSIYINDDLTIAADYPNTIYYGKVDVADGVALTIDKNSKLMYHCGMNLNTGSILNIEDGASLVSQTGRSNILPGAFLGIVNVKRLSPAYPEDYLYSYWSSPVFQPTLGSIFYNGVNNVTPDDYWSFQAGNQQWKQEATATVMALGVGYAITGADGVTGVAQERTFTHSSYTWVNVTVPLLKGTGDVDGESYSDFNLIGNPYPSALDLDKIYNDNTTTWDGIAYLYNHQNILPGWTNNPDDYITLTSTGSSPPGTGGSIGTAQGFMIKAKSSGNLNFNTDQEFKTPGDNTTFYKKSPIERVWLVLSNNDFSTPTLLGFTDKATDARDDKYDGVNISGSTDLQFYSLINDVRFAVQATDSDIESKEIELGMYTGITGKYTISIFQDELNGHNVYLEDKLLGVSNWNLSNTDYEFDIDVANTRINDRFIVSFTESTLSNSDKFDGDDIKIFLTGNLLSISNNMNITKVEMISTSGEVIETWKGNSSNKYLFSKNLPNGVYIIMAYAEGGVYVKKVFR